MSTGRSRRRGIAAILAALALMILAVTPVAAGQEGTAEGCPGGTALLVTFAWNGSGYAPVGGDPMGVSVAGDGNLAHFASAQAISALVVTAGAETRSIALDAPEMAGSVSPHNYEAFGGATISSLGFCTGAKSDPGSGARASIELAKTATCATVNTDGSATVTGTIDVYNHSTNPARITWALDSVLVGNSALGRAVVTNLIGVELSPEETASVPYSVTFQPGSATAFDNFVEVTIERADTGAARHKVYNARAQFALCAPTPSPSQSGGEQPNNPSPSSPGTASSPSPRGAVAGGNPPLPDTAVDVPGGGTPAIALAILCAASLLVLSTRVLAARRR